VTETKHEETRLTQQRHNEELLELLEKQQSTLVQNSKDLADYEKTLVQMAAELDQFRQMDTRIVNAPSKVEPQKTSTSPLKFEKSKGSMQRGAAAPPPKNGSNLRSSEFSIMEGPCVSTPPMTNAARVSTPPSSQSMVESTTLGVVLKVEGGRVWVHACLPGGAAAQCLIIDVGDEVLALNGQDLAATTDAQVAAALDPAGHSQKLVTFFLAKKDMPSRRCRVVLKRKEEGDNLSAWSPAQKVAAVTHRTPPKT